MVQLNTDYQTDDNVMGGGGFPLQEGEYTFIITGEEVSPTKANPANSYLKYDCVVDTGAMQGTEFGIYLNLFRQSRDTAQEIAEKEFNTLRMACGLGPVTDTEQLVNCRAVAIVKKKTRGNNAGELYISGYDSIGNGQSGGQAQQTQNTNAGTMQPAAGQMQGGMNQQNQNQQSSAPAWRR